MSKKKAIKITTATAIAASAFVAVAPTQSEAATSSVDKAITKATNQMAKAYDTYHKTAKNEGKLPATGTIRNQVALAKDYYAAAEKEIAKNGGSKTKKAAYTKTLNAKKYFLDRAEAYLAAINTNLNPAKTAFTAAVETGKAKNVVSAKAALKKDVDAFKAIVAKIYGPDVRDLLEEKYATPATDLSNSVNDELKVYEAYKAIEAGKFADLAKTEELINSVKTEVETLKGKDTKLAKTLVEVVAKNIKAFEDAKVPTVKEVSAINGTQATVKFNKEITEATPANFTVVRKDDANLRAFVTKAEISPDKKSVTLTFANKFDNAKSYEVVADGVVSGDKKVENSKGEFTYVSAPAASVELNTTTIASNKNIKDIVKVTDTLGRDITNEVELEFQTSNGSVVSSTGLTGSEGTAIVKVLVKGTSVATANTVVTVSNASATSFVGFNIGEDSKPATTADFKKLETKDIVTSVAMEDTSSYINLYYLDQYNKETLDAKVGRGEVTYTNLTPNVLVVDEDGKLIPVSTGNGVVKVKVGNVETTLTINVRAKSVPTSMTVDKDVVNAVTGSTIPSEFTVKFKDQYNIDGQFDASKLSVKSADESVATASTVTTSGDVGSVKFSVTAIKEGNTAFTLTYTDGTKKIEKVVPVVISKAGNFNGYKVEVDYKKLNFAETDGTKTVATDDADEAQITVYEVDNNGNKLNKLPADATTLTFAEDSATKAVAGTVVTRNDDTDKVTINSTVAETKATLNVKVGTLVVDTITFDLFDTTATASKAVFNNNALPALEVGDDMQEELATLVKLQDQYGKDFTVAGDVKFDYVVTNKVNGFGVAADTEAVTLAEDTNLKLNSTADIVITKVTYMGGTVNLISSPVVVKAVVKGDSTAPAALVLSDLTVESTTISAETSPAEVGATVKVVANGAAVTATAVGQDTVEAAGKFAVTGLTAGTDYDVYVIDAAGNVSPKLDVKTAAAAE